jgi:protein-disulfide isomerase
MNFRETVLNAATVLAALSAVLTTGIAARREFGRPAEVARTKEATAEPRIIRNWMSFSAGAHRMGATNPRVTIIEFGDFECPACRAFWTQTHAVFGRHANDVTLAFRHWPLSYHRLAYPAARAAECAAAQGRFEAYYNALYGTQDSLGLITFHELAKRARVPNLSQFDGCNASVARVAVIDSGSAAAMRLSARGTPTLLVNGLLLPGVPDSAALEQLIADAEKPVHDQPR